MREGGDIVVVDGCLGLLGALVAVVGLALCNGLLALALPWPAALFTSFGCGVLAMLAATIPSRSVHAESDDFKPYTVTATPLSPEPGSTPQPTAPPWAAFAAALAGGLLVPVLGGPNGSFDSEFGIDRMWLLPHEAQLFDGPPAWHPAPLSFLCAAAASVLGAAVVLRLKAWRVLVTRIVLGVLIVSFLVAAAHMNPDIYRDTEAPPQSGRYVMDSFLYLRTHDLMQHGMNYYHAFYAAYTQRKGERGVPGNWLNWRPPVLPLVWMAVPGGPRSLLYCFWALTALTLLAAFSAAHAFVEDGLALWSPVLLGAYLLYGADSMWFAFHEFWASCFMLCGLWAWLRGQAVLGAGLWALAATAREHFGFLVILLGVIAWRRSGRASWAAATAACCACALYAFHYSVVARYVLAGNPGLGSWRDAGPSFVLHCLRFGTVYLAARTFLLMPLLALGACGALQPRDGLWRLLLGGMTWIPPLVLLFIGGPERFYWGTVLVPQLLWSVPLIAHRLRGCETLWVRPPTADYPLTRATVTGSSPAP